MCELVFPIIVRNITGIATENPAMLTFSLIAKTGALYIILRLIDTAATYYMNGRGHVMGTMMETDMRTDLFAHLQTLSHNYYSETKVGQIMSRITSDLFDITEFAHHCPEEFIITGLKIIVAFDRRDADTYSFCTVPYYALCIIKLSKENARCI